MDAKPLWKCPVCGHQFVTRNMFHSCGRFRTEDHFLGKDPAIRELFDRLRAFLEGLGPVRVYAQKSRIVFQVRVRFAAAMPHKEWLDGHFWLKRRASHPLVRRVDDLLGRDFIHHFRLTSWDQFDPALAELLRESYQVGCQSARNQKM